MLFTKDPLHGVTILSRAGESTDIDSSLNRRSSISKSCKTLMGDDDVDDEWEYESASTSGGANGESKQVFFVDDDETCSDGRRGDQPRLCDDDSCR